MRAAKAMKKICICDHPECDGVNHPAFNAKPDIHEDEHEPQYHPPIHVEPQHDDWRRPKQDAEAMQSYHRRPPGWA